MTRNAQTTSKIMKAVKAKDTRPELLLRRSLWAAGIRGYRKNYSLLSGRPDVVFTRWRVAVFVDGDFWHGGNWRLRGLGSLEEELARYSPAWQAKIRRNVERDETVTAELRGMGWTVIRIWASDLERDPTAAVWAVREAVFRAKTEE